VPDELGINLMLTRFLKLIGVGDDILVHLDQAVLAFQRPGLLWLGLALLVPVGYWVIRRQRANLATASPGLRNALNATRLGILLLLVLVLAGPYLRLDYEIEKRSVVALVFDQSDSMQLPAGPFENREEADALSRAINPARPGEETSPAAKGAGPPVAMETLSRSGLVQAVLNVGRQRFLDRLTERFEVRGYAFGRETVPFNLGPQGLRLPELPPQNRAATCLGDAIGRVLDDAAGRPLAGVFLFTDGQNTGGRSPGEAVQAVARAGAPVFAVPSGSRARPRDVAIVDVFTAGLVAKGDTARVSVTVESQGFDSRPVKVELREGETLLSSTTLTLHDAEQQKVDLSFLAKEAGAKYLTVAIAPLPEEPAHLLANNSEIAFVRISEEKLRVLLIDGLPRWDFRFLKNAIRRDNGLGGRASKDEPDVVLEAEVRRRPAPAQAQALPTSVRELAEYHTVILGDASPRLLGAAFVASLIEAVRENGLGLIVTAGPQFVPHRMDERLREILPVRLQATSAGLDAPAYRPFSQELSVDGSVHEVMRLYDDPSRNRTAWTQMPPYYWSAAVERAAPAASVLAWNPDVVGRFGKQPLVAHHYAGRGRVLFVGTDSTWLWRRNVGDRFFYKFWGQALRFVARRDDQARSRSWLEVRPVRARPGEEAQVELMAIGAGQQLRAEPSLAIQLASKSASETIQLTADPATKGRFTGKFLVKEPGEYTLKYEPGAGGSGAEARFRVVSASEELRHPSVDRAALESLAGATEGKLVELPELYTIPSTLKGEASQNQVHREASLWDNGVFLLLLIFLYSLDVALRRLAGLS
jgi:hypothetical protein